MGIQWNSWTYHLFISLLNSDIQTSKMADREDSVYQAKLAEQAERYDEMVESMKKVARQGTELTVEERNLLSVAYKNVIGARRASWRIVSSLEQKDEGKVTEEKQAITREYRKQIETELNDICQDVLNVIDKSLVAYKAATDIALTDLQPTHPIRLGLALNYSV